VGDEVDIYRQADNLRRVYRVAIVAPRVDPSDTHWLDADGRERLTLQTSTGPVTSNPRFIVVAYPE
jgi:sortase (surface protein transpeptidase)